jgi:sugar/nucleoside kinase (ribokinase family)
VVLVTLGDALLDVIVRLGEPLAPGADAQAATRTGAGGQAANVAAWAAALGAKARCVAKRGADVAGRLVAEELESRGVELVGPSAGRNGVVVSLVAEDGERTMASDRGPAPELEARELDPNWFACECLHISGYALMTAPIDRAAKRGVELARANGARISVDLSAWTRIQNYGARKFRRKVEALEPDVVFANEAEWQALGVADGLARTAVIKRGPRGIIVFGQDRSEFPAHEGEVVDTTGAGDAFAAGFLIGGPELALETAARCVAQLGAMP